MTRRILSFRFIATLILSLGVIILGGLNIQQKRQWVAPADGISWIESSKGVEATLVVSEGPGARAGIEIGDVLVAINETIIENDRHVTKVLYDLGEWSRATYQLERNGATIETTIVVAPRSERFQSQFTYLEIIGILHLLVGLFVITKRWRAPHAVHFYWVCLISFVLYVFQSTGKFNDFDWTIFWSNQAAYVLLPPLFMHFCLEFPLKQEWIKRFRLVLPLLYMPGLFLFLTWIAFVIGVLSFIPSPIVLRHILDGLTDFHFGVFFIVSALILMNTYRTVREPELRQQMKWVTRGTVVAVVPYFLFQSLPRILGMVPHAYADIAVIPLAFIPISFGYAIHRYRLMDVDILFKSGMAYTLATAAVVGFYVTVFVVVGGLFGESMPQSGVIAQVIATIIAALLLAPIKDQIQIWLDKFFYKDRYNLRLTVTDFGRTLGAEIDLPTVLDRTVERLVGSLHVDRMAVLLEDPDDDSRFVLARSHGFDLPIGTVYPFLKKEMEQPYIFFEEENQGLNYFIPCRAKDRVIAYLGMGRTENGDYLTSEDVDLLKGVSDYIGIAVENATLYRSLEDKVSEYESLKDFNENIIESISVGVMVEIGDRIIGWNRALEALTGHQRSEMLGKSTSEVIPDELLERLRDERNVYKHRWDNLVVNCSVTPLVDKEDRETGRLIIVDDITDRIRMEDQLSQSDRLTSMGLLAAGVAHEVNTPLAVISSDSQMLRKQLSPNDESNQLMDRIIKQTFRASEIVNNLLSFSRANATEFVELDVHQVIIDTITLLDHQLKNTGVEVKKDLSVDEPSVLGNAGKLQQVFLNLFLNSKDAMSEGGILRIRTEAHESQLRIWIEDTGSGIDRKHIKKIYDPFFTTKEVGKGTGLGLSVSYGIIQEHGGSVAVESVPGKGTSFSVDLPMARKPV